MVSIPIRVGFGHESAYGEGLALGIDVSGIYGVQHVVQDSDMPVRIGNLSSKRAYRVANELNGT